MGSRAGWHMRSFPPREFHGGEGEGWGVPSVTRLAPIAALLALGCASHQTAKGGLVALNVSAPALDRAHEGRRLALVVGIDTFDDPGWRPLRYAAKDATDLAAVLGDPTRGGFEVSVRTAPQESRR